MSHVQPEVHRVGDLELDEHIGFQRRSWRVQRIGQIVVVLVVLAALAGLFGGGGLAHREAQEGGARIEYPRFLRAHSPIAIRVSLPENASEAGATSVAIDASFFDVFDLEQISPAPEKQRLGDNTVIFQFAHTAGARGSITVQVKATRMGLRSAGITVGDEPPIVMRSFIFP